MTEKSYYPSIFVNKINGWLLVDVYTVIIKYSMIKFKYIC